MKLIYYIVFTIFLSVSLYAETHTNMQLLDSLASKIPGEIKKEFPNLSEVQLDFNKHPNAWFVEQKIVNSKLFSVKEIDTLPKLSILLSEFGVKYNRINSDSLEREVTIKYEAVLYDKSQTRSHEGRNWTIKDNIAQKDLAIIESSPYPFNKAPVPEEEKTWLDEALEPVILVGSAALTVILFFTVRSN